MSVEGLCQICETAPARHRCERCASLVCTDHYDADSGYCTVCAAGNRSPD
jgi:hypothetical protein